MSVLKRGRQSCFPIAITYNADLWQGRSVSSFNTNERFQVTARATNFLMQAFEEADMDADACLTAYLSSIEEVDGVSNFVEAENLPLPDGLDEGAEIVVSYDFLLGGPRAAGGHDPVPVVPRDQTGQPDADRY